MSDCDDTPSEAELLLPWYGTGRLTPEETARVEAWLDAHPEMRARLEPIAEEIDTTIAANEALPTPPHGVADRLMDRVAAEPRPRARRFAAGLLARLGAWIDSVTPEMRGALAAAAVVLVIAQVVVIGLMVGRGPATYETATGIGPGPAQGQVLVAFAPEATAGDINTLLADLEARIVDGPKPGGIFALALAKDADPQAAVETLRARDGIVRFAAIGETE